MKKLTLNAGVRFDYFTTYFPEQHLGPGLLVPNRNIDFPEIPWVNWKDITPRLAAVYDLFGDGKTALKVSLNKYMVGFGLQGDFGNNANPINRSAINVTRSWNDANRDFVPQCDLTNGSPTVSAAPCPTGTSAQPTLSTNYDPDTLVGWGKRGYNWEFSAGVQHELLAGVSVNAAYFRRVYGNFTLTDNLATAAADYGTYQIVAPADPTLPGGGGQTISGLKDLNPDKVGQVNNYFTFADNYGKQIEDWHGVDVSANTRRAWHPAAGRLQHGTYGDRQLRGPGEAAGVGHRRTSVLPADDQLPDSGEDHRVLHDSQDRTAGQRDAAVESGPRDRRQLRGFPRHPAVAWPAAVGQRRERDGQPGGARDDVQRPVEPVRHAVFEALQPARQRHSSASTSSTCSIRTRC